MQRWLRTLAALTAVGLLAAACGGGQGFEDDGDGGDAGGDAELQLMGWSSSPAENEQLQAIVDEYNEQSDNSVQLNLVPEYDTTLQTALAGGRPPDVFYVDANRLPDMVASDVLDSGTEQIEDPDDFFESQREAFTHEGEFWCPPKDFSTLGLVYNTDMLEEAGVDPPTTWEELRDAAETLTRDDVHGLVMAPEYPRWGAFMMGAGGAVTDEDFTEMALDSEENREAFEYLQELYANDWAVTAPEVDAGWPGEAFGMERAAMTIEGNWIVSALRDDFPDVNWAVAEVPEGPEGPGTLAFTVCYAVPADAANADASWDLVNYLTSPEQMLAFTEQFPVMPTRESVQDDWVGANPDLEAFITGAEYARPFQFVPGFQQVLDALDNGMQGIADGSGSIDSVIDEAQQAGERALEQPSDEGFLEEEIEEE